ncbi:hypothetical protein [Chitinophaga vietnamensis]|uniref:hypothetical protein n=1 Tax=Chitinophaga vietnamensis TaxID=2593957 RepID=UPI001177700F|nr:hypothetical protein [Chitinophaga vietnamensis]
MKQRTNIAEELQQIAPGVKWPVEAPFKVPAGYFEQLPAAILAKVEAENQLPSFVFADAPFSTPTGYFEQLPALIMEKIRQEAVDPVQEELKEIAPFLAAMPRQTPFSVPQDYFGNLPLPAPTPVIPLHQAQRRRLTGAWMKWAVAACLTAFLGTSALVFLENRHGNEMEAQLNTLSNQDIVNYLQTHTDAFDNETIFAQAAQTNAAPVIQSQLNEELSPEAIEQYLKQTEFSKEVLPNQ